jgi:hypothetical protein
MVIEAVLGAKRNFFNTYMMVEDWKNKKGEAIESMKETLT